MLVMMLDLGVIRVDLSSVEAMLLLAVVLLESLLLREVFTFLSYDYRRGYVVWIILGRYIACRLPISMLLLVF